MSEPDPYQTPVFQEPPAKTPEPRSWPLGLLLGVLNFPASVFFGAIAPDSAFWTLFLFGLPFWAEMIAGIVLLRRGERRVGKILLFGPAFSVVIVVVGGVFAFGVCLVLLAGQGSR